MLNVLLYKISFQKSNNTPAQIKYWLLGDNQQTDILDKSVCVCTLARACVNIFKGIY